jgi:GcrA cell cycle regulator
MSWTDERVETLKRMWAEGQSASQIARELGGVTRNAVIGKVHRLGLSNRVTAAEAMPASHAPDAGTVASPSAPGSAPGALASGAQTATAAPTPAEPAAAAPVVDPAPAAPAVPDTAAAAPAITDADDDDDADTAIDSPVITPMRRQIVPAGQPLPPQPAANEISAEALATVREVEKHARKLSLMELTERTCKWPVGDPATDDFWFCGLPSQTGKPYCEAHVGVAFQPMSARRDRRR